MKLLLYLLLILFGIGCSARFTGFKRVLSVTYTVYVIGYGMYLFYVI